MSSNPVALTLSLLAVAVVCAVTAAPHAGRTTTDSHKCAYWHVKKNGAEDNLHLCSGCPGYKAEVVLRKDYYTSEKILYLYCMVAPEVPSNDPTVKGVGGLIS